MQTTKLEQALEVLVWAKRRGATVGLDPSRIENPVQVLVDAMKVSRTTALAHLRELEIVDAVVVYKEGAGNQIVSALLARESLAPVFHEEDEDARCATALWKNKRPLRKNPNMQVVYSCQFDTVRGDAHLSQTELYNALHRLEECEYVQFVRKGFVRKGRNNRILFIVLSGNFPAPQ